MDDNTKSVLTSKTVWAAVAVIVLAVLKILGRVPDGLDETALGAQLYSGAIAFFGLLAMIGRIGATQKVALPGTNKTPPTPPASLNATGAKSAQMVKKDGKFFFSNPINLNLLIVLIVGGALTFSLLGCAATPINQWAQADETYTATLNVLSDYRAAGKIDDDAALQIEGFRSIAEDALDKMHDAAVAGDTNDFQTYLQAFNTAIHQLIALESQGEMDHGPDTRPATGG